ncbi:MAG: glycoside hydrolase family 3 N-terminal domain-containing protein [Acidobacteriota bacterium]
MRVSISYLIVFLLVLGVPVGAFSQTFPAIPGNFQPSERSWKSADKMLRSMSVEEKVGQVVHIGINAKFANQDSEYFKDIQRQVVENKIGGIIFFGAPIYETTVLINRMQQNAKVPLLMALDAETGIGMRFEDATNFPWAMAIAATGEPDFARRVGVITAREAKAIGIQHVYAPVLDVNNNADNPVINVRSFGEDPNDVARFGTAFIDGIQSQRIIATAKHFPGHGDTNVDSHRGLPIIDHSRESLEKTELVPFRAAIKAGVASIMIAHIALPQIDNEEIKPLKSYAGGDAEIGAEIVKERSTIPATLSAKVQTDLLRHDLGFNGLIVTDAMSMSGLTLYFDQAEAGVRAFLAGADILEKPSDGDMMIRGIVDAVKSGRISQTRLDDSVRKILAWKYELGLFKNKLTDINLIDTSVSGKDSTLLANEIAVKAVTLVRNDENDVPLDPGKKVAILAVSNGFDGQSTLGPLTRQLQKRGIKFTAALIQDNTPPEQIAHARAMAADADVVIAAMYGRVRSGAKNSVGLPDVGVNIIRELIASNKKVVGVSFGNPYILDGLPQLKTYVVGYGDMSSLQRATLDGIFGFADITGHLPISLPGLYPRGTGIQMIKR